MEKKLYESPILEVISFAVKERLASEDPFDPEHNNQGALSTQEGWEGFM